jgi:hypothetical protein
MGNGKLIKVIGLAATIVSFGATLLADWVNDKKMDERIGEKIQEALTDKDEEES